MAYDMFDTVAKSSGVSRETAQRVVEEFLSCIHQEIGLCRESNKDYLATRAYLQIGRRGYFHLLGVLEEISSYYLWEPGSAEQYLMRLPADEEASRYEVEFMKTMRKNSAP